MAIGITGDTHLLIDINDEVQQAVELNVSRVRDNINAGVTQRVYADGVQRSISGYSTLSAYRLTCQRMTEDTYTWIRQRAGQNVVWRDDGDILAWVTIGNLNRDKPAARPTEQSWNVSLDLFLVEADVTQALTDAADLVEVVG